ncbi:G5 domain-containing protein [Facklamia sp. P13069]|uniref:G5 domain-containing protein n=1 Tax=Facklamia sp. P13069 TaxID=3421954 RepID=UPI003D168381
MTIKPINFSLVPKNERYPSHIKNNVTDDFTIDTLYHGMFPEYELSITSDWYENITKKLEDFNLLENPDQHITNNEYQIRRGRLKEDIIEGDTYLSIVEGDFNSGSRLWMRYSDTLRWVDREYDYLGGGFWLSEFHTQGDVTIADPKGVSIYNYGSKSSDRENELRYWGVFKKSDLLKVQLRTRKGTVKVSDGENLLLNSWVPHKNNNYPLARYDFGNEKPIVGEYYTITLKGKLGENKSYFGVYNSGGLIAPVIIFPTDFSNEGIVKKTFKWKKEVDRYPGVVADDSHINVFPISSSVNSESEIEWIKIEKGKESTPYSKHPSEQIVDENNRNLLDIVPIEPLFNKNVSSFGKSLAYVASSDKAYDGLKLNFENMKENTRYYLRFNVQKLSGNLKNIGGHLDKCFSNSKIYIDGQLKSYSYSQPGVEEILNDGNRHKVDAYITFGNKGTSNRLYIQPNRGLTNDVEVLISNIYISDSTGKWQPVMEDIETLVERSKSYVTLPDGKVHYLPYEFQQPYSDITKGVTVKGNRLINASKNYSLNPDNQSVELTIPLSREETKWVETSAIESLPFVRETVNDRNKRASESYVRTNGEKGSKTIYSTKEFYVKDNRPTGTIVKDYEVITKQPVNEIYIQGTATVEWKREVYKTEPIPYSSINRNTDTMYIGETRISQSGITGVRSYYREVEYLNGSKTTNYRNVDTSGTITKSKRDQITLVGTKPREATITFTNKLIYKSTTLYSWKGYSPITINVESDFLIGKDIISVRFDGKTYIPNNGKWIMHKEIYSINNQDLIVKYNSLSAARNDGLFNGVVSHYADIEVKYRI